jgi:hypothetical protein
MALKGNETDRPVTIVISQPPGEPIHGWNMPPNLEEKMPLIFSDKPEFYRHISPLVHEPGV